MFDSRNPHPIRSRIGLIPVAAVFGSLVILACIERSNPFDPINAGPKAGADVRAANRPRLDSLTAGESAYGGFLKAFGDLFSADSLVNEERGKRNLSKRSTNATRLAANDSVGAANKSAAPESLALKALYDLLDTLKAFGPFIDFLPHRNALQIQASNLMGFMDRVNSESAPTIPYPKAYADSVFAPFQRDILAFSALQTRIDSAGRAVADSNLGIAAYNAARGAENALIGSYNDSIAFVKQTKDRKLITKPDSLQGSTFVAKAGDSLVIGPGSFPVDLRFTNSGTPDSPIVVRGYPGMRTVFTPMVDKDGKKSSSTLILSGRSNIRFEDIVFRGGGISGAKLENGCRGIYFRRCTFDSSGQFGVEVIDSDVDMLDCRLIANGKGARLQGKEEVGYRIRLKNVLVARNQGHGLEAITPFGDILNCTVADNGGEGIRVNSPRRELNISNSIVSGNGGYGIFREAENGFQDLFHVELSDVWGHAQDKDWYLQALDSARASALKGSNLNTNPQYIDAPRFDYRPRPGSVLAGYEVQAFPIVIGWRP